MRIQEHSSGVVGRVDRSAGIIYGVKILGKVSKNGREYSDRAIDDACALYEGVDVNIDHNPRHDPDRERGISESFGVLKNIRKIKGEPYGDIHFLKSHPEANMVCEKAERFPNTFGLSHDADGVTSRRDGKTIVESITAVNSVDLVRKPATNGGLYESMNGGGYGSSFGGTSFAESVTEKTYQPIDRMREETRTNDRSSSDHLKAKFSDPDADDFLKKLLELLNDSGSAKEKMKRLRAFLNGHAEAFESAGVAESYRHDGRSMANAVLAPPVRNWTVGNWSVPRR